MKPAVKSYLQHFINNPGLQHLAENIFVNLNDQNMETCRGVNRAFQQFLDSCQSYDNPMFRLKQKFPRISKKNQMDWTRAIYLTKETDLEKYILLYLKKCEKNERVVDLPCYIDEDFLKRSAKMIRNFLKNEDAYGKDTIHSAAKFGDLGTIKHLALLKDNPNAPDRNWKTPIYWAALNGHTEIVKILAPLTAEPNAPDDYGNTPIHQAAYNGLVEIVKILAPLTDNPNAPDNDGKTPSSITINAQIQRYLEFFNSSRKSHSNMANNFISNS